MISNMWGKLDLYCNNGHEEKMDIKQKTAGLFYECPCCRNSFSIKDIEKMLDKIEDAIQEADLNNEVLDIKNLTIKIGNCHYKIVENGDRMKVFGLNKKAVSA